MRSLEIRLGDLFPLGRVGLDSMFDRPLWQIPGAEGRGGMTPPGDVIEWWRTGHGSLCAGGLEREVINQG